MLPDIKTLKVWESPKWGFYTSSEVVNGRLAMLALIIIIIIEILTKESILKIFYLCN
ncbi:unnamed protein product [Dictyota dichotoma]